MSREYKWTAISEGLPDKYETVITRLFGGKLCINSIQGKHHTNPDGSLTELYEWANNSVAVTHWMPVPAMPEVEDNAISMV